MRKLLFVCFLPACFIDAPKFYDGDGGAGDVTIDARPIDATPADAVLATEQAPFDFGDVATGQMSAPLEVTFRNTGTAPTGTLSVSIGGTNQNEFDVVVAGTDDCAGQILEPDDTCTASARFAPGNAGAAAARLEVTADPGGTVFVDLSGDGLSPGKLEITAGATLMFATIEIQSSSLAQTLTVRNMGGTATPNLETVVGVPSAYSITSDTCGGVPLAGGASCSVEVVFNPATVGSLPSQISVRESPSVGVAASATGTGTARLRVNTTGTGAVDSAPGGISCTTCGTTTVTFSQSPVTLTASNLGGFAFDTWSGACASANPSPMCTVSLTAPLTTVGATFLEVFPLDVSITGAGGVTSSPPGVQCGGGLSDCSEGYKSGTSVTLTATPDADFEVFAWTGAPGCTVGMRMCTVTMSQARSVGVEFRRQYTVTVVPGGSGSGTVTGGTISCPGTCSATLFAGSMLTLTESPGTAGASSQIVFGGWSGGTCSGNGTTCSVTFDSDRTVNAAFTLQHRLSVTITGTASGTASGPGGFTCSTGTCTRYYDAGAVVTLTSVPSNGTNSYFGGYNGACTGVARACAITMTAPLSTNANFRAQPGNLVFVSSLEYPADLGGVAAYDVQCNALATAAGINTVGNNGFVAWMSDSTSDAKARLGAGARGFVGMDGLPFADDQATLFLVNGAKIFYPIALDENGVDPGSVIGFSGTTSTGVVNGSGHCSNWSSTGGGPYDAGVFTTRVGPQRWSNGGTSCTGLRRIMCFGKTSSSPVVPTPVSGAKRIFLTNVDDYVPGVTTPDAACTAAKPASVNSTHAVIATTTGSAGSRLVPTRTYAREDNAVVGTGAQIVAGAMRTGPWQQGDGVYHYGSGIFLIGASTMSATGTDTCADWTAATSGLRTWAGMAADVAGTWLTWSNGQWNCSTAIRVLCVEE